MQQEEWWDNGKLTKLGDFYLADGTTKDKGTFENGNGTRIGYNGFGVKVSEGNFVNGLPNGKWTYYHPATNKVSGTGEMKNGDRIGKWSYFDEQGRNAAEGVYENDEMVGIWKIYEEGKLVEERNMD